MSFEKFDSLEPPVDHDKPGSYAWPKDDILKRLYATARFKATDSRHWDNLTGSVFLGITISAFQKIRANLKIGKVIVKPGQCLWSHELLVELQEEVHELIKANLTPTDREMSAMVLKVWESSVIEKVRNHYLKLFFVFNYICNDISCLLGWRSSQLQ
jgi:hypothetical protein